MQSQRFDVFQIQPKKSVFCLKRLTNFEVNNVAFFLAFFFYGKTHQYIRGKKNYYRMKVFICATEDEKERCSFWMAQQNFLQS